jgi:uncharacterized membrane protein
MANFPLPAPAFDGRSRRVAAASALAWIRQGWAIFGVNPGTWIAIMVVLLVVVATLGLVPLIGHFLVLLLAPLLLGGMLCACQKAAREQRLQFADLFAGLRRNVPGLLLLGALYIGATLLVALLVFAVAGSQQLGSRRAPELAAGSVLPAASSLLLLGLPLLVATWFAPALIVFNRMPPLNALKTGVNAGWKNLPVLLVLAVLGIVPCLVAALPFGLGFTFLGPVLAGSMYASYHDIFLGD